MEEHYDNLEHLRVYMKYFTHQLPSKKYLMEFKGFNKVRSNKDGRLVFNDWTDNKIEDTRNDKLMRLAEVYKDHLEMSNGKLTPKK